MISAIEAKPKTIDIVTVVYQPEILLLKLQARSLNMFFNKRQIRKIFVIVNELSPDLTYSQFEKEVMPEYGDLARKLVLLPYTKLMAPQLHANGWRRQQTIKLLASRIVDTPAYLLLDAKNHFLRAVSIRDFIDPSTGRMRSFKVRNHGSLGTYLTNCLNYFSVPPLGFSLPATTPYVMSTLLTRSLLAAIESRESLQFDDFMHLPHHNFTEFFLYYAYLRSISEDIEEFYKFGPRRTVSMFTRFPGSPPQIDRVLTALVDPKTNCFGLHRNRVSQLADSHARIIAANWTERGLFPSDEEGLRFISSFREGETSAQIIK